MSSGSSRTNRRTAEFRRLYAGLPGQIQEGARKAFRMFLRDLAHPALRRHRLADTGRGRHKTGSWSVSITMQYRAIYVEDGGVNVWYWIGNHNDYEDFTGVK